MPPQNSQRLQDINFVGSPFPCLPAGTQKKIDYSVSKGRTASLESEFLGPHGSRLTYFLDPIPQMRGSLATYTRPLVTRRPRKLAPERTKTRVLGLLTWLQQERATRKPNSTRGGETKPHVISGRGRSCKKDLWLLFDGLVVKDFHINTRFV